MKNHNQFMLIGNKKFFFMYRPFIKALCKSGAVGWRLDRNLDNDIPKGYIFDEEKSKFKFGGYDINIINRETDDFQIIRPAFMREILKNLQSNSIGVLFGSLS